MISKPAYVMIAPTAVLTIAMFLACLRLPRVKAACPSEREVSAMREMFHRLKIRPKAPRIRKNPPIMNRNMESNFFISFIENIFKNSSEATKQNYMQMAVQNKTISTTALFSFSIYLFQYIFNDMISEK